MTETTLPAAETPAAQHLPTVEAIKPPTAGEPPTAGAAPLPELLTAAPGDINNEPPAEPAEPVAAPDVATLQAQIAALTRAQAETAAQATAAGARAAALEIQAVDARRAAAIASIGLPAHYAALAPRGDPADPDVAQAFEAFRSDAKFAPIFSTRANVSAGMDTATLDSKLGERTSSPFSSPASRAAGWARMKGEN